MAKFVECSLAGRPYGRDGHITNHAVNIDLCTSLRKSRVHWYPDNTGIPSIKFEGCDTEWVFYNDKQRDEEYARLIGPSPTAPNEAASDAAGGV